MLKFIVPSTLGVLAFLTPVQSDGVWTIPMAVMSNWLTDLLGERLPAIVVILIAISAVLSTWFSLRPAREYEHSTRFRQIFAVSKGWLLLRISGLLIALMIIFKVGPEFIWADVSGQVVLNDLASAIVTIFVFASFLLPLLTEYGLMELIGTLLSRVFKKAFTLPGRSCIDALASWMAAAPVGVLITSQQYETGNYSGRESAVIATNFSVVSLPFCVIVAEFSGMAEYFVPFYLTVVIAGLVAAMITPRIPPLSRIPDTYSEAGRQLDESDLDGHGLFRSGLTAALTKAEQAPKPKALLETATHNLFDIWFGLMPPLVAIGTLGIVLAEFTPLFQWLAWPLVPVLELLRLPEAQAAAPAFLVGFTEMFLPAVLSKGVESQLTTFVIISVSITQLIYMTEVGVLILKTRIPLSFFNLVQVFLLRTAISLPVATIAAHMLFDV